VATGLANDTSGSADEPTGTADEVTAPADDGTAPADDGTAPADDAPVPDLSASVNLEARFLELGGPESRNLLSGCPATYKDPCLQLCVNGQGQSQYTQMYQGMSSCCQMGPFNYNMMQGSGFGFGNPFGFGSMFSGNSFGNPLGFGSMFGGNPLGFGSMFGGNSGSDMFNAFLFSSLFGGNTFGGGDPCGSNGFGCGGGSINPLLAFSSPLEMAPEEGED